MQDKLIAAFSQVGVMQPLGEHSKASSMGACHNFTIEWVSFMLEDKGLVSDAAAAKRMNKLSARRGAGNPVLQKVFSQRWAEGGQSYTMADGMMISLRGMKEVDLTIPYEPFDQKKLLTQIKTPKAAGFVYSFWFKGSVVGASGGAHTIGFFRPVAGSGGSLKPSGDYVSAFDPNFGEYYVPALEFNYWLNKFKDSYGKFTNQMLKFVTK